MRILYIDSDPQHARELYAQFLSYRGVQWDLVHCESVSEAHQWIEREHFDIVLQAISQEEHEAACFDSFIQRVSEHTPIVILAAPRQNADHVEYVRKGGNDCLPLEFADGQTIMRRLRMAVSRFHQQRVLVAQTDWTADSEPQASITTDSQSETSQAKNNKNQAATALLCRHNILFIDDTSTLNVFDAQVDESHVIEHVTSMKEALEALHSTDSCYEVVVVEQEIIERDGLDVLSEFRSHLATTPIIMMMVDRSDSAAVSYVDLGIDDCLVASAATWTKLQHCFETCKARAAHTMKRVLAANNKDSATPDRRSEARGSDRRNSARYLITRPLLAIPVLPNGAPDTSNVCDAFTIDVSTTGLAFQVASAQVVPSRHWVLGFEAPESELHEYDFANVSVKNVSYVAGGIRLGALFQHPDDDLLRNVNLIPRLCHESQRMITGLPDRVLRTWENLGVLRRRLLNRIKSCPECKAVALISDGCRECGSTVVEFRELIHHFACAYVGDATEFTSENLCCPKCLSSNLVAGVDFEIIKSRYQCPQCDFNGSELEQVGSCLSCQLRFPVRMVRRGGVRILC